MDDVTLLSWIDRGRTLAYLFVAVGVVGEFLVDRVSGPIIKRRDETQRTEIARLNKEAGDARKDASGAMERAARLEKEAEQERLARVKIEEKNGRSAPYAVPAKKLSRQITDTCGIRSKCVCVCIGWGSSGDFK